MSAVQAAGVPVPFGRRLAEAMVARGPLCVGIDPHPGLLSAWDLPVSAAGVERFARTVVEAVGPSVAAVKPQSAFFEVFGSAGIAVLERVLADCRDVGTLSVLDAKRGDIGSTMDAYAAAYLTGDGPLAADQSPVVLNSVNLGLFAVACALIAWLGASDLDKFVSLIGSIACVPLCYCYRRLLPGRAFRMRCSQLRLSCAPAPQSACRDPTTERRVFPPLPGSAYR